jgi:hypothetical protein
VPACEQPRERLGLRVQRQSGGFKLLDCYSADDNCYIDAGDDVRDNGLSAEIATDAGADGQLTGDTSSAACAFDFVTCAPTGAEGNNGVFVVTPRDSDGTAPGAGDRYPFYAFVTG